MTTHDESSPVTIHQARNVMEAGMVRAALEVAGIPCTVDNEQYAATELGGYPAFGALALRVIVPARFAKQAGEVLAGMGLR